MENDNNLIMRHLRKLEYVRMVIGAIFQSTQGERKVTAALYHVIPSQCWIIEIIYLNIALEGARFMFK